MPMVNSEDCLEPLLQPQDISRLTGVPLATVYQWQHKRTGPVAIRVGRHLRYRRQDFEAWLKAQELGT